MDGFQPRIEEPPQTTPRQAEVRRSQNETLREFVRAAEGKWCIVCEAKGTTKQQRQNIRSRLWGVFMCATGLEVTGFEIRIFYVEKVLKIYAIYDSTKVVKSPQGAV